MKLVHSVGLLFIATTGAQGDNSGSSVTDMDNGGACCPSIATIQLQPVYYSEEFNHPTLIDPFNNGETITVTDCPATVVTSAFIKTTITGSALAICPASSSTPTTTVEPTATSTILPQFFLAYSQIPAARLRRTNNQRKRQVSPTQTASPVVIVDMTSSSNQRANVVLLPQCNRATRLTFDGASLFRAGTFDAVAKQFRSVEAVFGTLISPTANSVNTTFSFDTSGVLSWTASDGSGAANFFACPDGVYAGFPIFSGEECIQIQLRILSVEQCNAQGTTSIGSLTSSGLTVEIGSASTISIVSTSSTGRFSDSMISSINARSPSSSSIDTSLGSSSLGSLAFVSTQSASTESLLFTVSTVTPTPTQSTTTTLISSVAQTTTR